MNYPSDTRRNCTKKHMQRSYNPFKRFMLLRIERGSFVVAVNVVVALSMVREYSFNLVIVEGDLIELGLNKPETSNEFGEGFWPFSKAWKSVYQPNRPCLNDWPFSKS